MPQLSAALIHRRASSKENGDYGQWEDGQALLPRLVLDDAATASISNQHDQSTRSINACTENYPASLLSAGELMSFQIDSSVELLLNRNTGRFHLCKIEDSGRRWRGGRTDDIQAYRKTAR